MSEKTKSCPWCGEIILAVAKKCKHCGEFLDRPPPSSEITRATGRPLPPPRSLLDQAGHDSLLKARHQPAAFHRAHAWFVVLYGLGWCLLLLAGLLAALAAWQNAVANEFSHPPRWTDYGALDRKDLFLKLAVVCLAPGAALLVAAVVPFLILLYRSWNLIQDGSARTTAGKAVGFLFIPFFNFYWLFVAIHGLALGLNAYGRRHGIAARRVPAGVAMAYCILTLCSAIPVVNLLLAIPHAVLLLILAGSLKDAGAAIARAEWEGETLPAPRKGRAGLVLALGCVGVAAAAGLAVYGYWPARPVLILRGHTGAVTDLAFSPDGKHLASASLDGSVRVWDVAAGPAGAVREAPLLTLKGSQRSVHRVAFSPDGQHLASAGGGYDSRYKPLPGELKLWDVATGGELFNLTGHKSKIESVAFSPDGKYLASTSKDYDFAGHDLPGEIKIWDAATGREGLTLKGHGRPVNCLAYSLDGRLASASDDRTVKVWDPVAGRDLATCHDRLGAFTSVAFSPDGKRLASGGSWSQGVKLWDPATGQEVFSLAGQQSGVYALTFSPDGRYLAFGDGRGQVKVWDLSQGKESFACNGSRAAFSPDGQRLATTRGAQVHVWDLSGAK